MTDVAWVLGRFESAEALVEAARRAQERGWDVDTYAPYPLRGLPPRRRSRVPLVCLTGGLLGAGCGYAVQWWTNAVSYALDVGGRPAHAPPSFVPVTFELGILGASLATFLGLCAVLGLPRLHHPLFEAEGFEAASVDAFWLSVRTAAPPEERGAIVGELVARGAVHTRMVEEAG